MGGFGVYRVSGHARTGVPVVPWAVVLKTTHRLPDHDDPDDWNYWKREALLYASGLLDDLPPGLRAAQCFLVEERPPDSVWLWLEMLRDVHADRWPRARYRTVGEQLGCFNGAYLTGRVIPDAPWLQGSWLRSYVDWYGPHLAALPQHLDHPVIRRAWPAPTAARVLQLWNDAATLLDALDRLPQTFCHRDVFVRNCFLRTNAADVNDVTAIDWAFAGRGAVGEEAAGLLLGGLFFHDVTAGEAPAVDRDLFDSYVAGLRRCGWDADVRLARLGYAASFALRYGVCLVGANVAFVPQHDVATLDAMARQAFELSWTEQADHLGQLTVFALQLGDEARQLLYRMSSAGSGGSARDTR
jgi:hypothetical protein